MARLYKACQIEYDRNLSLVEQLIAEGHDPNYRGSDGDSCLHRAAYYNSPLTVDALVNAGAHPHVRVCEYESILTWATPMYFACFYGPHTVCPLIRADIRHYGMFCCCYHPLTYCHNIFVGATWGLCCLCCFQTIPQLTDCSKTWTYCCVPLITFPGILTENCSLRGIKVARIQPGLTPHEKELIEVKKDLKKLEQAGGVQAMSEVDLFKNMVTNTGKKNKSKTNSTKGDDGTVASSDSRSKQSRIERALQARE